MVYFRSKPEVPALIFILLNSELYFASFDDTLLEFGVTILRYRKTPFCVGGKFLEILIVSLCQAPQRDPLCKISGTQAHFSKIFCSPYLRDGKHAQLPHTVDRAPGSYSTFQMAIIILNQIWMMNDVCKKPILFNIHITCSLYNIESL